MADTNSQPRPAGRRPPEEPVILVPGHHFFTAVAEVPAGTPERDRPAVAALALEADSPFAEEQLARGHYAAPAGWLVVYAALRRKLAAFQETWARAPFVVPDFATWLPRAGGGPGVVILETPEAVTGLEFADGAKAPRQIVSRPVPAEPGGEDGTAAARTAVLARLGATGERTRRYRLAARPCTVRGGRYQFHWEAQDGPAEKNGDGAAFSAAELWAMDLRDPAFLRTKRRDFQWNRYAWATLLALGAAAGLLLAAELGFLALRFVDGRRQARLAAQAGAARTAEANSDIINRLAGYIDRKPQPLELLAYVNDLRPRSIYFTRVSVDGGAQIVLEGSTTALAEINEFEAALKRAPALGAVEVRNIRAREGGGTFQLTVGFRPGFTLAAPGPAVTPAPAPAVSRSPERPSP